MDFSTSASLAPNVASSIVFPTQFVNGANQVRQAGSGSGGGGRGKGN